MQRSSRFALFAVPLLLGASVALAQDKPDMSHEEAVTKYVTENIKPWLSDAALVAAIEAETPKHSRLGYDDILQLDKDWKEGKPIVQEIMGNDVSKMLTEKMAAAPNGAVTEIFVMDGWGFNVGQTGETSDYYQADEPKWQKTFAAGPEAPVLVTPIEEDGGKKIAQASLVVTNAAGEAVGAVHVGIDADKLK